MLIGLSGPLGAGKSLAAKILSVQFGYEIRPFAGPLKSMMETAGVPRENLYGTPEQKAAPLSLLGGKSARHAMQTLGTDWGRLCIGEDFWANSWVAKAGDRAIADDLRFQNESEVIRSRGGIVIQIIRDITDLNKTADHASENFQAVPFDVRVVNDKCPTILKERLLEAVRPFADRL